MATETMTEWEKNWMSTAPQDCLRTFVLNPDAEGGYSEYGETMLDFDTFETITEQNGQGKVSVLKADAPSPLRSGTFVRMYLFGEITDGVPVWQFEENGEPKNFRNFYINKSNSRWYERHPTGHVDRWRHDYLFEEVIACLKDYPIRSTKTFAEGAYTFKQCLDIAFKLAFRPRSVGNYAYSIKPFPDLDKKNSKLVYSNSTLYDVVTDIGKIIDAVPSMEIVFENGVYIFELRFIDRYGLEGEVHDISYFDMQLNDATNTERDSSAGACISFIDNVITGSKRYPNIDGTMPADTNLSRSWEYFELPYPVESVEEVDVYWQYEIKKASNEYSFVELWDGTTFHSQGYYGDIMFKDPIVIREDSYASDWLFSDTKLPPDSVWAKKKRLYLREYSEYIMTPNDADDINPTRQNTIYYTRGDNKIHLEALFNNTYRYWYKIGSPGILSFASFSNEPNDEPSSKPLYKNNNKFYVAVKFKSRINGAVKGINSKPSDFTAFFNQQGQVVDIYSIGSAVNNYTKSMFGENRVACHRYVNVPRKEMYEDMPSVGSSVMDRERGKRYVVTDVSFTRKMNGGLLIATLAESRAGKSRVLIAGNRQKCYAIPNNSIVDSMSHTHIICKMGIQKPFEGVSYTRVNKSYLFNAFRGIEHGSETQPDKVKLTIVPNSDQYVPQQKVDVFFSRMRLSILMSFRMQTNSLARIENGEPIRYTDDWGELKQIFFEYKAGDITVVRFSQTLDKDSYEILNHTAQVSWIEYGNLQIGESLIDMSYFGNGDGLSEPLQLVLLSSRMHLNDSLTEHIAARYDVSYFDDRYTSTLTFTPSIDGTVPEHVGWAIVRGDRVILLDNFDVLKDNNVKIFYNIEVRD